LLPSNVNFSTRSYEKELLDRNDIPFADIEQNMRELNFINSHLGGHTITLAGFKQLLQNKKQITVCEIGCGGGDNLWAIQRYCNKNNIRASFIGIDMNADCIAVAKSKLTGTNTRLIVADYKSVDFNDGKPGIIFSSLFCHHFTNEELIFMLQWMKINAADGFFINDLHRHLLAYYSIKLLSSIFSSSYLVKNDAPLSVKRGFKKQEWKQLMNKAGIHHYHIHWKWAFRWLLISMHA
jgi:2-polyprenyl-3-methyl-5-hydroxy-6-metoxy-1,4-benzoquinol methylase